jgi:hypothetical protein
MNLHNLHNKYNFVQYVWIAWMAWKAIVSYYAPFIELHQNYEIPVLGFAF